jgi:hypothetical protein
VVRRDVDQDRRLDSPRRHLTLFQCLRDEDAAAQPGRRERLIGKQFGETEFERARQRKGITGCPSHPPPNPPLRGVRAGLKEYGHNKPPWFGLSGKPDEGLFFREMGYRDNHCDQKGRAEEPRCPRSNSSGCRRKSPRARGLATSMRGCYSGHCGAVWGEPSALDDSRRSERKQRVMNGLVQRSARLGFDKYLHQRSKIRIVRVAHA